MLTLDRYNELRPFIEDVKKLISKDDTGEGIAALVNVPTISPLYGPLVGMVMPHVKGMYLIGVGRDYEKYFRLFLVLHEVFHIKLGHIEISGFLNQGGAHADYKSFRDPFEQKLMIDTEKESNLYSALALFNDSILEKTGYQQMQEIKDISGSLEKLSKTLDNLRYRWNLTKDPVVLNQIEKCESEQHTLEDSLENLNSMIEEHDTFKTAEDLAAEYKVPPACIACYLEAKRLLGYSVIPVQEIDWLKMFDPKEIEAYKKKDDFEPC